MFDDVISLIQELDESRTEQREVFATVESVGRTEFFSAAQSGMRSDYRVTVWTDDYAGEQFAIIQGKKYDIYRTYMRKDGKTELYCGKKIGVV